MVTLESIGNPQPALNQTVLAGTCESLAGDDRELVGQCKANLPRTDTTWQEMTGSWSGQYKDNLLRTDMTW